MSIQEVQTEKVFPDETKPELEFEDTLDSTDPFFGADTTATDSGFFNQGCKIKMEYQENILFSQTISGGSRL
ncbi:MAG: hypothetical protein Q9M91_00910 [Candidatus Dojkabacteria bacterium]|nr:hypothetical protein [Candidatus Dojkabacteria bacterium]